MQRVAHDAIPPLTRFFIALWNLLMKALVAVGLMPSFRKQPWLFAVLIFVIMIPAPYFGVFIIAAGCFALNNGAEPDNNFMASLREKKTKRFMGAQSEKEEREALQGEALLTAYENGATIDEAMKVHEAMGQLYDAKKDKDSKAK